MLLFNPGGHVLRALILILGVLVALILLLIAIGYALPISHVATRATRLAAPPERVFGVLRDVEKFPTWRSDVKSVEVLATTPALRWRERGDNDITFEMEAVEAPTRIVTRIADKTLPFGGSWTYELSPQDGGTRLVITENGDVYNPLFRFMSRFVFGHTGTIDKYMEDLARHLR
jgi:polyketide cyclase/dehydrase/lipid transport protein